MAFGPFAVNLFLHVFFLLSVQSGCNGGHILLVPAQFASHISQGKSIGRALLDDGHKVTILMAETTPVVEKLRKENPGFTVITHSNTKEDFYTGALKDTFEEHINKARNSWTIDNHQIPEMYIPYISMCHNALTDDRTISKLKNMQFDFGLIDAFPVSQCYFVLMHRLGIPYGAWTTHYVSWMTRNPSLPSFVPLNGGPPRSEQMDFWERLDNFWRNFRFVAYPPEYLRDEFYTDYYGDSEVVPFTTLQSKCAVWFIDDELVLNYPRPLMPNEVFIGGMTTKPANPLSQDLEDFMNGAEHGVIVMSLGHFSPDVQTDIFVEAFKQVKQRVVWRLYKDAPAGLSENVLPLKWLPQNDVLGHPKTKLFITHCGANGQHEALYHAVPMLGFALFAEQFHNCHRMDYHGMGIALDSQTATVNQIVEAAHKILKNDTFYANVHHRSQIYKSANMTPMQRVVYWVNHVIRYGSAHLRSHALDMPWYQYIMADIFFFFLSIVFVIGICIVLVFQRIRKTFMTKEKPKLQ